METKIIDLISKNLEDLKEAQPSVAYSITSLEDIGHLIGQVILSETYDEDLEDKLKEFIVGFNAALIHRTEIKLQLKFKKNGK